MHSDKVVERNHNHAPTVSIFACCNAYCCCPVQRTAVEIGCARTAVLALLRSLNHPKPTQEPEPHMQDSLAVVGGHRSRSSTGLGNFESGGAK